MRDWLALQQIIDIGPGLMRVTGHMAVDFPVRPGELVSSATARIDDRSMRVTQLIVGAEVGGRRDQSRRSLRCHDATVGGECSVDFHPTFNVDDTVVVDRHMPTGARDVVRADEVPHVAAGFWNYLRKLELAGAKTEHCDRMCGLVANRNVILHLSRRFPVMKVTERLAAE